MGLFNKEPKEQPQEVEEQEEQPQEVEEPKEQPQEVEEQEEQPQEVEEQVEEQIEEEPEPPRIRIDEESARIQFKILIRDLFDMEQQLKGQKKNYTDVNERKRDKTCTEMELINRAETIKLQIKPLIDAFVEFGYDKSKVEQIKREALEGMKHYIFYTL